MNISKKFFSLSLLLIFLPTGNLSGIRLHFPGVAFSQHDIFVVLLDLGLPQKLLTKSIKPWCRPLTGTIGHCRKSKRMQCVISANGAMLSNVIHLHWCPRGQYSCRLFLKYSQPFIIKLLLSSLNNTRY